MTTNLTKVKEIKALEGYTRMTDADIVARATAVQTGMTGNSNFQNLPVDLATFETGIESLSALISEALDRSKKIIAQKNKQRQVVIKSLKLLTRFVEVHSNGDMAIFKSSALEPVSDDVVQGDRSHTRLRIDERFRYRLLMPFELSDSWARLGA